MRSMRQNVEFVSTLTPRLSYSLHELVAQILVEAAQHLLAAMDQGGLRAKAGENTGELDRDIAAARNQDRGAAARAGETHRWR